VGYESIDLEHDYDSGVPIKLNSVVPYKQRSNKMTFTLADVNNIEFDEEISEADYYESIQRAINSGMWSLQGSYGRTMMDAIESGRCLLGHASATDYDGNIIPSRLQVKDGTKGSWDYVSQHNGFVWQTKWQD